MIRLIRFAILTFVVLFVSNYCGAQVLNDNINMQVKFVQGWGSINNDGCCGGDPEQTWISRAVNDTDGTYAQLFSKSSGAANTPNYCYTQSLTSNVWGSVVSGEMGTITNSSSKAYDWEVFGWEDDGGQRCRWDSGDESRAYNWGIKYPQIDLPSKWTQWEGSNSNNNTKFRVKHTWRYTNGQYASSALDFGTITSGTKYHTNSNRSAPSGAVSSMGYGNFGWSATPFRSGNDVTYRFQLTTAKEVTISTSSTTTNFDTYIHLISLNEAGTTFGYIEGDDDDGSGATSVITRKLCPGYYGVVVEGYGSSSQGDFRLSVGVTSQNVSAGAIRIGSSGGSTSTTLCPNANLTSIFNNTSAVSQLGGVSYTWERSDNYGSWYTISGTGSSNTSSSNLGNMGTSGTIRIRRKASDCGSSAYSNTLFFYKANTSASPGSITGSKQIPFPQEVGNGSIGNVSSATASPSAQISWQKNDGGSWQTISGATSQSYTLPSSISQTTQYRRKVRSSCTNPEVASYTTPVTVTVVNPNGIISGFVKDRNGVNGIQGITITARRTTSVPGGQVNKTYTTTTGNGGAFNIGGVYYGSISPGSGATADFEVTPSRLGHAFDPDMAPVTVSQNIPSPLALQFKDTTGYVIAGTITQECNDCDGATVSNPKVYPLPDVKILESMTVNGNPVDNQITTGLDGTYATIKEFEGSYIIKPEYETHEFELHQQSVAVGGNNGVNISGIDFKDTTTHVISGQVIINCTDFYIGRANLTFSQVLPDQEGVPVAPTFQKTITTNQGSGAYSVRLPAAKYRVSVNSFSEIPTGKDLNNAEMVAFLNAYPDSIRVRDITNVDTTLNLYFHEAPQIQVTGLAGPCDGTSGLAGAVDLSSNPIFVQNEERTFTVKIWEGNPSKACPAQDSLLIVNSNIEVDDANVQIDTMTLNGQVELTLTGGIPNIIPPHHKTLAFVFTDRWLRAAPNVVMTPVVTGLKSNIGSFATVSPQVPLLILRDPPGDQSFSTWSQNNTVETATRFYNRLGGSSEVWGKVKVGVETQNGIGVAIKSKVWGELGGSLITTGNYKKGEEVVLSTTNSQGFSTSNSNFVTGEKGDVYIGAAMNLKYAVTNEVIFSPDTCSFYLRKFLMIDTEGFETKYIYSENHIVNTLIPILKSFRDNPGNTQAQIENYEDQISVWEQTIENNKELKRKAQFVENISFDGASGAITSSTTATSKKTISTEFDLEIDAGVATELGAEIGGAGISGGTKIRVKMETGESKTNTVIQSTTTGYTINDQNLGDFFTIDVKTDPVYNTPVFDLVAGTSSCPTEPGTQPRYEVSLTAPNPVISGIPANAEQIFTLNIGNTSQSEENRTYWLRHINASSNGATITKDGNPFIVPFNYNLNYLQQVPVSIGVSRFDPNVYGFENIRFEAIDACRGKDTPFPLSRKEVSISAFFANGCSPITLSAPENGFVLTQDNNNLLGLNITDYTYANLDEIVVEYAKVGTSNWIEAVTLPKAQIQNSSFGTQINLNVTGISDGEYNFRLKLKCGLSVVYSKRVTGTFDRKGPEPFGLPQPADDVYSLGDEISMTFNEALSCGSFNSSNFSMTRLSNTTPIPAILGCFNNKIILTPTIDILQYLGDSIRVSLINLSDKYNNPASGNYIWDFNIGSPEVDTSIPYYASLNSGSSAFSTSSTISNTATSMNEDAAGTLSVNVSVNQAATDSILVYFIVAGTATYGVDYTVSGAHTFNGNEGSVYIPKGGLIGNLQIDPTADTDEELDESIILGILSGGDYNIGGSNKVTLTIINDDTDDCENGGLPFAQGNNASGNTTLAAGEYHKSLLESNGNITSPTTVIFKGERSITLQPGFEVESGSVFIAIQEDCPELIAGANGNSGGSPKGRISNPVLAKSFSIGNYGASVEKSENALRQQIGADGKIAIPFTSNTDQEFEIKLFTTTANELLEISNKTTYETGVNAFTLNTNDLQPGTYFIRFTGKRDGEKVFHKVIVKGDQM